MRVATAVLLTPFLLLSCAGPADSPPPAPPSPPGLQDHGASYVFGSPEAPAGGRLVVGVLVSSTEDTRLVDLLPAKERDGVGSESPPEIDEQEPVEFWSASLPDPEPTPALAATAAALAERLGIEIRLREILEAERDAVPVVLTRSQANAGGLTEALCREALETSPAVRRLPRDPLEIVEKRREGDEVVVRFATPPDAAALVDLEGRTVWSREGRGVTVRFPFPAGKRNPFAHVLLVRTEFHGVTIRRARTVESLVGALEHRIFAAPSALSGGTYAVRVHLSDSRSGRAVLHRRESIALVRDGQVVVETTATSDEVGDLVARLAVPDSVAPGTAFLRVGDTEHAVTIRREVRVSVVTDRGIYRPTDDVEIRVLVARYPGGRPAAGEQVVIAMGHDRRTVVTSEHGIASARLKLVEAASGVKEVSATAGHSKASSLFRVEAFETPTFLVEVEPDRIEAPGGEIVPVTVRARHLDGLPLLGAEVYLHGPEWRRRKSVTDARGEARFEVAGPRAGIHATVKAVVVDVDGRTVERSVDMASNAGTVAAASSSSSVEEPAAVREDIPTLSASRRVFDCGEILGVEVRGPDGPLHVDVTRDGILLRGLEGRIENGEARMRIPLGADLAGILTLHAYRLDHGAPRGSFARFLVRRADGLTVEATPDRTCFAPGETAVVDVSVRDAEGKPRAAALGYWAVDEGIVALEPLPSGHETVFGFLSVNAVQEEVRLAESGARTSPWSVQRVLGEVGYAEGGTHHLGLVATRTAKLGPVAESLRTRAVGDAVDRLRERYLSTWKSLPLDEIRAAGSLRQHLRRLVRDGRLSAEALIDPWGSPLVLDEGERRQFWWRSVGPDLVDGTGDDVEVSWDPWAIWDELPERVRRLYRRLFARDGCDSLRLAPFHWASLLDEICPGGSAGGRMGGRRARRGLRAYGCGPTRPALVRRDFPPTLCFVPEAITDPEGRARLEIPLADTITTWRMRLVASDAAGAVGIGHAALPVRQPLHVRPRLPRHLTTGDRLALPVSLRNETDRPLEVEVSIEVSETLAVEGRTRTTVTVAPLRTGVCSFALRATGDGSGEVRITASAGEERDAAEHAVTVHRPERRLAESVGRRVGRIAPWKPALRGPGRLRLDVYPDAGVGALAGFEGLMGEPHGCFEQASSTLYPMVMAIRYLRSTKQSPPALEVRALRHVRSGLQQLLAYEVPGESGGFSLFGQAPASAYLTAYGAMEFMDIRALGLDRLDRIPKMVAFLERSQEEDGSWPAPVGLHAEADRFAATAHVARALARCGRTDARALAWLEREARGIEDVHALAQAALACLESDRKSSHGRALVDRVAAAAVREDGAVIWRPAGATGLGARGRTAAIETTALAVLALLRDGRHPALAREGLDRLIAWRGADGRFGTTRSTVLALEALLAAESEGPRGPVSVLVLRDGEPWRKREIAMRALGPTRLDLGDADPAALEIRAVGASSVGATLSLVRHVPWEDSAAPRGRVALAVSWPKETLVAGAPAAATVEVRNPSSGPARLIMVEVGLPPGCDVDHRGIEGALRVERAERAERAIVIYLDDLEPKGRRTLRIPFTPRHRLDVRTAPSRAYEYYTPDEAVEVPPMRIRAE